MGVVRECFRGMGRVNAEESVMVGEAFERDVGEE